VIKRLFLSLILVLYTSILSGETVHLQSFWTPPTESDLVRTYNLWQAPTPTGFFELIETFEGGRTNSGFFITEMEPGETVYFELTATYDDNEESGPSNVALYTHPLTPPPPLMKEAPQNLVVRKVAL
jgi:hypothetical protein